ncbi:MAG TPA: GntR family transcriptional regulator [Geminicoccaceae bacterium]|nr:GntR family transcriptional regulator [Geminicoccaceae bacterium]
MTTLGSPPHDFRVHRIAAPLRHSVTESIRSAIAAGLFKAGERLPERDLCAMTGVSRTLVREALRQLESEGLIHVVAHRGPIVARVTPEQAEGIYQVRMELEGLASQLFAERASAAQRKALEAAFEEVKKSYEFNEAIVRLNAKNRFYECLVEGSGNEALGITLRMLNSRVTLLRATSLKAPGRMGASLAELQELMDALMAGDGRAARAAATRHVQRAAAAAIALLRAEQTSAAE